MSNTSVFKQASLSTVIVGLGLVTSFIKVIFFTRVLTISDYGVLSLLSTTVLVFSYAFSLGTFQYVYKEKASSDMSLSELKSVSIGTTLVAMAFVIIGWMGYWWLSDAYGVELNDWLLTLLISATSSIFFIFNFYIYGQRQIIFYNWLLFLRSYAWVYILIPLLFLWSLSITSVLLCWLALTVVALGLSVRRVNSTALWASRLYVQPFLKSVSYGLPLLPSFLAVWGVLAICKYILAYISDTAQVALFSLSYTLFDIVFIFAVNISQVFSPYFFREWNQPGGSKSSTYFNMAMKYSLIITVLLSLGLFLLGDSLVTLLAGEGYADATSFGVLFVFLPFLRVLTVNLQQRHLASDKTKQLGVIYLFSFALTLVTGLWWGSLWNVYGVVCAMLFTQFVVLLLVSLQVKSELDLNNEDLHFTRLMTVSVAIAVPIFIVVLILPASVSLRISAVVVFPLVYFFLLIKTAVISKKETLMIEARLSQLRLSLHKT